MEDCVFVENDNDATDMTTTRYLNSRLNLESLTMSSPKLTNKETDNNLRRPSETSSLGSPGKFRAPYCIGGGALEMLIEPVDEEHIYDERSSKWEYRNVSLNRISGYGFGIAVSGGRDNPHFKSGDPSIVVSDVLQGGPAAEVLKINDRIISANGVNLENADYTTAVQIMKDSDQLNLIIRRRVPLPVLEYEQKTLKFTLTKTKKKDDFGIVLGCKFYIKGITNKKLAEKEPGLREGDVVAKINDVDCDDLTMTEARKLLDKSRERLSMVIKRDVPRGTAWKWSSQATLYERLGNDTPGQSPTPRQSPMVSCRLNGESLLDTEAIYGSGNQIRSRYSRYCSNSQPVSRSRTPSQNLYDQSDLYGSFSPRNNGVHISVQSSTASCDDMSQSSSSMQVSANVDSSSMNKPPLPSPLPEPRFVTFCKEGGSVGVRVIGGNEVGIFVSAVQVNSPASAKGVKTGDKILRANDRDMRHVTREEAVLHLLSLVDQVDLILQYKRDEYDMIRTQNLGDNFFIRVHFDYDHDTAKERNGMSFKKGDIFQIVDTLYAGTVGWWQATKIAAGPDKANEEPPPKGVIPNLAKAEQIMANDKSRQSRINGVGSNASSSGTGSLLRKKISLTKRSKSLTKSDSNESVFPQIAVNFPAYERVQLKHPGFLRPVILYGPLADVAAEKLLQDFALRFACPTSCSPTQGSSAAAPSANCVKLLTIKEVMNRNKHCLLEISPTSIEKLQYAQYCPIVVFINVDNRSRLRELRRKSIAAKSNLASKSTKKLMDEGSKLQKSCRHLFTAVLDATNRLDWFDALRELISHLQDRRVWMAEARPTDVMDDDFLFSLSNDSYRKYIDVDGDSPREYRRFESSIYQDQSDYGGTLTLRKVQKDPNMNNAKRVSDDKPNGVFDNFGGNNANDSEVSSSVSQPISSECGDSNMHRESSKESTPDCPSSNTNGSNVTPTSSSSNAVATPRTNDPITNPNNALNRLSSSSNGTASANCSAAKQPTDNFSLMNQLTAEINQVFEQSTNGTKPRGTRHMSEPGFYDVRQVLQGQGSDYSANIYNYGVQSSANQSARKPYLPTNNRPDNGPKMFNGSVPYNSQMSEPGQTNLHAYQQNEFYRIRPHAISRTPSNPAPSITSSNVEGRLMRNYGYYPVSPNHVVQGQQQTGQGSSFQPASLQNGVHTTSGNAQIYGEYSHHRIGNVYGQNGLEPGASPRVRPPPPPAPSTPRSPHTYSAYAASPRLTSTNAITSFPAVVVSCAPTSTLINVNPLEMQQPKSPPSEHTSFGQQPASRNRTCSNSKVNSAKEFDEKYENAIIIQPFEAGSNGGIDANITTIRRRPIGSTTAEGYNVNGHQAMPSFSNIGANTKNIAQHSNNIENRSTTASAGYRNDQKPMKPPLAAKPSIVSQDCVINDPRRVLAHVKQVVGPDGGKLISEATQVVLKIPPGALEKNEEIFFKVFQDSRYEPPLDKQKGEQLLSPLLMLGPQSLTFSKPVELLLPHNVAGGSAEMNQWSFVVKKTTANNVDSCEGQSSDLRKIDWQQIPLADLNFSARDDRDGDDRPSVLATAIDGKFASIMLNKF